MMKAILISLTSLAIVLTACAQDDTVRPDYTVLHKQGNVELRAYAETAVAEVVVSADNEEPTSAGFRPLFDYISGANKGQQEIPMTAPVGQQAQGQEIPMTAPVGQQQQSDTAWSITFYMPPGMAWEDVPEPTNPQVNIRQVPPKHMVAVSWKGGMNEENKEEHRKELEAYLKEHNLQPQGEGIYAYYSAPYVPVFMKEHELLMPIAAPEESDLPTEQ